MINPVDSPRTTTAGSLKLMPKPLTADEILPLVASLSPQERARLLRLIRGPLAAETAYSERPPGSDEFSSDDDALGWDAEGWEKR